MHVADTEAVASDVFAPVPAFAFASAQEDDCLKFLEQRSAQTERIPIVDERQLFLLADGTLADSGYRFNSIGFEAVARQLCAGLSSVFHDLSGMRHGPDINKPPSVTAAVGVFNAALRVRFESLRERTLLFNHQTQAVEGLLGLEHKFLDNCAFFQYVRAGLEDSGYEFAFSRAEVVGRELRLFFIDPESRRAGLCRSLPEHIFATGWYFANREDSGNAVRAARSIFTVAGPAVDGGARNTKVVHAGADFIGRIRLVISRAAAQPLDMSVIAANVNKLAAKKLGFSADAAANSLAVKHWINYLVRFKLRQELARTVVQSAETVGADFGVASPSIFDAADRRAARNGYDLVCSILRVAQKEYAAYRDVLQSLAFRFLTGGAPNSKKTASKKQEVYDGR